MNRSQQNVMENRLDVFPFAHSPWKTLIATSSNMLMSYMHPLK